MNLHRKTISRIRPDSSIGTICSPRVKKRLAKYTNVLNLLAYVPAAYELVHFWNIGF